jgi:hypothetical protein
MNTENQDYLKLEQEKKLPTGLNVLTILTLVMCAYELYSYISNFFGAEKALQGVIDAREKMGEDAPGFAKKMLGPDMIEMMEKSITNKVPMLIIGLLAVVLCTIGAMQMRKQKKQGYLLWLIGEVLPIISAIIFIGGVFFKTFAAIFLIFPVAFIVLYTFQRKHLIH